MPRYEPAPFPPMQTRSRKSGSARDLQATDKKQEQQQQQQQQQKPADMPTANAATSAATSLLTPEPASTPQKRPADTAQEEEPKSKRRRSAKVQKLEMPSDAPAALPSPDTNSPILPPAKSGAAKLAHGVATSADAMHLDKLEEIAVAAAPPPPKRNPRRQAASAGAAKRQSATPLPEPSSPTKATGTVTPRRTTRRQTGNAARAAPRKKSSEDPDPLHHLPHSTAADLPSIVRGGVFAQSGLYANSWAESSFANVNPSSLADLGFGTYTAFPMPAQHDALQPGLIPSPVNEHHPNAAACPTRQQQQQQQSRQQVEHEPQPQHFFLAYEKLMDPYQMAELFPAARPVGIGKLKHHRFVVGALPAAASTPTPAEARGRNHHPSLPQPPVVPTNLARASAGSPAHAYGVLYAVSSAEQLQALVGAARSPHHSAVKRCVVKLQVARTARNGLRRLRTVARVDAAVLVADHDKPAQLDGEAEEGEQQTEQNEEEQEEGATCVVAAAKKNSKKVTKLQLQSPQRQRQKQKQTQQAAEAAVAAIESGSLPEQYERAMNRAILELLLHGVPRAYVDEYLRPWIPAPRQRLF